MNVRQAISSMDHLVWLALASVWIARVKHRRIAVLVLLVTI